MNDTWTYPADLVKKIPPQHYMHVMNNNTSIVRVEVGPQTYVCKDEESAVYGPTKMVVIAPRHYITIKNPVLKDENGEVIQDKFGMAKLAWGDEEIRLEQEPFPLYPGELWDKQVKPLRIIPANTALRLKATRDFHDKYADRERKAGEEWYFKGPGTYFPQIAVQELQLVKATVIQPGEALHLKANSDFVDQLKIQRFTGDEWMFDQPGAYLPSLQESIVKIVPAIVLTDKSALHLQATHQFVDEFGKTRYPGDTWLITKEDSETHIPHVYSRVKAHVPITTLTKRQYAIIRNPVNPVTGRFVLFEILVNNGSQTSTRKERDPKRGGIFFLATRRENRAYR
eukprot:TRINITY_DN1672_c0_g1_i1.p1 TRINITY_DN1672_c0_g1~~TRINITY_DN1672_c0_g1_i1.p1  ORF type:complete len:341 (-),score=48.22 TRINITY_DN1672_c0_g1_i1:297-1319(-)